MIEKTVSYRLFCDSCDIEFMPTVRWEDDVEVKFQALNSGWHIFSFYTKCPRCTRSSYEGNPAKVA